MSDETFQHGIDTILINLPFSQEAIKLFRTHAAQSPNRSEAMSGVIHLLECNGFPDEIAIEAGLEAARFYRALLKRKYQDFGCKHILNQKFWMHYPLSRGARPLSLVLTQGQGK